MIPFISFMKENPFHNTKTTNLSAKLVDLIDREDDDDNLCQSNELLIQLILLHNADLL